MWTWSMIGVSVKTLPFGGDLLRVPYCLPCHLRTHLLLTLTRYSGSHCHQLVSSDQRLYICPELSLTQPKPTHCLLFNFFQGSTFNFPRWATCMVPDRVSVDGRWSVTGARVPCPHFVGRENAPFWLLYLKKSN